MALTTTTTSAAQIVNGIHGLDSNTADAEVSTTTSPLSEVEDKDGLPDDMDDVVLGDPKHNALTNEDSDSNLSDAGNVTEAETERMFDTPQVQRHKKVIVDQFSQDHVIEKTPTRPLPRHVAGLAVGSDVEDSYGSDAAPILPLQSVASKLASHKRKRQPDADLAETSEPTTKRSVSGQLGHIRNDAPTVTPKIMVDSSNLTNGHRGRDIPVVPHKEAKELKRATRSRRNSVEPRDGAGTATDEGPSDQDIDNDLDHDLDHDDEAEAALRNEEELEKKRIAMEEWQDIEARFSVFRDRLYKDRLEKLEKEEQALLADEPYHPEYLAMLKCIDARYEEKMKHINSLYEHILRAHEEVAVSTRTQIWSQFYQSMREKREESLEILCREHYDTMHSRRKARSGPDLAILFPTDPAQQTRDAVAYHNEISMLSDIAKSVGFPAVPHMHGASELEIEDDFHLMQTIMDEAQLHQEREIQAMRQQEYQQHQQTAAAHANSATPSKPPTARSKAKSNKSQAHQMVQVTTAEDAAAAAVLSAPKMGVLPQHASLPHGAAPSPSPQLPITNRRVSQAKAKEKTRLGSHVGGVGMPQPMRASVDPSRV